jgi:hypothetical protein
MSTCIVAMRDSSAANGLKRPTSVTEGPGAKRVSDRVRGPFFSGQIFIKDLVGKTQMFESSGDMTVKRLKELVEVRTGVQACQQRIIFAGRQLDDSVCVQQGAVCELAKTIPVKACVEEDAVQTILKDMEHGLQHFKAVLTADVPVGLGVSAEKAEKLTLELLRYLALMATADQTWKPYSPPEALDKAWHLLLQLPVLYASVCSKLPTTAMTNTLPMPMRMVDHDPMRAADPLDVRERRYINSVRKYKEVYGVNPPAVWSQPISCDTVKLEFQADKMVRDAVLADFGIERECTLHLLTRLYGC